MTREKGWYHPTVSWLSKPVSDTHRARQCRGRLSVWQVPARALPLVLHEMLQVLILPARMKARCPIGTSRH
eukprot:7120477-Prymnesium_polylepis.1